MLFAWDMHDRGLYLHILHKMVSCKGENETKLQVHVHVECLQGSCNA